MLQSVCPRQQFLLWQSWCKAALSNNSQSAGSAATVTVLFITNITKTWTKLKILKKEKFTQNSAILQTKLLTVFSLFPCSPCPYADRIFSCDTIWCSGLSQLEFLKRFYSVFCCLWFFGCERHTILSDPSEIWRGGDGFERITHRIRGGGYF